MKRLLMRFITFCVALVILSGVLASCADNGVCKVVFVQSGFENITVTIRKGESLSDVPLPTEVEGYKVNWDTDNFDNITSDMTVNAVLTPNKYVITYDLNCSDAEISQLSQEVNYMSDVILATPTRNNYVFSAWYEVESKKDFISGSQYTYTRNITLRAIWLQIDDEGNIWN